MKTEITLGDIQVCLESLEYSKMHIREAQGTPYEVRQENLQRVETVMDNLRKISDELQEVDNS